MRNIIANLTPTIEASGPHDFAVRRNMRSRQQRSPRPSHPNPTFVTIAKRPSVWAGMARDMQVIWARRQAKFRIFRNKLSPSHARGGLARRMGGAKRYPSPGLRSSLLAIHAQHRPPYPVGSRGRRSVTKKKLPPATKLGQYPIMRPHSQGNLMGIASLHPSYGLPG
jgi:hypothetical protein